jgi:hypothetical protein
MFNVLISYCSSVLIRTRYPPFAAGNVATSVAASAEPGGAVPTPPVSVQLDVLLQSPAVPAPPALHVNVAIAGPPKGRKAERAKEADNSDSAGNRDRRGGTDYQRLANTPLDVQPDCRGRRQRACQFVFIARVQDDGCDGAAAGNSVDDGRSAGGAASKAAVSAVPGATPPTQLLPVKLNVAAWPSLMGFCAAHSLITSRTSVELPFAMLLPPPAARGGFEAVQRPRKLAGVQRGDTAALTARQPEMPAGTVL